MNFKPRRSFTFNRPGVERSSSPRERSTSPRSSSPAPSLTSIAKDVRWTSKFRLSFSPTPKPSSVTFNDIHSTEHSSFSLANDTAHDADDPFAPARDTVKTFEEPSKNFSIKSPAKAVPPAAMSDFLSRESEILGGEFNSATSPPPAGLGVDIDLDRAASAFPDISLDGTGDIPAPVAPSRTTSKVDDFDFDDFASAPPVREVKVTGGDEIDQFESQFPELDEGVHNEVNRSYVSHNNRTLFDISCRSFFT